MTNLTARVLADIHARRVLLGPLNVVIVTDATVILPHEYREYIATVRKVCAGSAAMPEIRAARHGDRYLRLTTIGEELHRTNLTGAVSV